MIFFQYGSSGVQLKYAYGYIFYDWNSFHSICIEKVSLQYEVSSVQLDLL